MDMLGNPAARRVAAIALRTLAAAGAYFVAAAVGRLYEMSLGRPVSPWWPATGVALVCLLLLGARVWPGIAVGAFMSGLTFVALSPPVAAASAAGSTLAALTSYLLLRRVGFRVQLDRLKDALALVFLGALAGMLVCATVGSGVYVLTGQVPAGAFWPTWIVWWTGDVLGVLIIAPLLLVARRARWPRGVDTRRWIEAAALLIGMLVVMLLASRTLGALFIAFPFLIWAGLRFQLAGAAPCALIASSVALYEAVTRSGPFAHDDLVTTMINLQIFNASVALTALLLAVITTERNLTKQGIEDTAQGLAQVVDHLTRTATPTSPAEHAKAWPNVPRPRRDQHKSLRPHWQHRHGQPPNP